MNALTLAFLMTVTGGTTDKIADSLVNREIKRVGVIPTVISRLGEHESTVGSLGPRALTIARKMQEDLVNLSSTGRHQGKFSVVSDRLMKKALSEANLEGPLIVEDLGDVEVLQALSRLTGAGAFVTLDTEEPIVEVGEPLPGGGTSKPKPGPITEVEVNVIGGDGSDILPPIEVFDHNSLSKAAYSGQSFEIRRWDGETLRNEGIDTPQERFEEVSNWEFGKTAEWEAIHYRHLKPNLPHPLDIDDFPYGLTVKVDGRERKVEQLNGEYVLPLEEGEEYSIELLNGSEQSSLVALYVDGVSVIEKELLEPNELGKRRHWVLAPQAKASINGWILLGEEEVPQQGNRFEIATRDKSVASQQGFDGKIGMITALFYADDTESGDLINYPTDAPPSGIRSAVAAGGLGTTSGAEFEEEIKFIKQKRGLLMAAVTIFYRTRQEIDDIRDSKSTDHRLARGD
ncbi:MAG: hypothetical protein RIC55_35835 [Pirellulaceae bacterium]